MEHKHTPGPWQKGIDRGHHCVTAGPVVVAYCGVVGALDDEESQGNATMIAAVHDLLKSLKGLCGLAELRPGHLHDYKAAVEEARAAIAKATTVLTSAPATASYPCGSLGEPVESEGGEA